MPDCTTMALKENVVEANIGALKFFFCYKNDAMIMPRVNFLVFAMFMFCTLLPCYLHRNFTARSSAKKIRHLENRFAWDNFLVPPLLASDLLFFLIHLLVSAQLN